MLTDKQCDERDDAIVQAVDATISWKISGSLATGFLLKLNLLGWDVRPVTATPAIAEHNEIAERIVAEWVASPFGHFLSVNAHVALVSAIAHALPTPEASR